MSENNTDTSQDQANPMFDDSVFTETVASEPGESSNESQPITPSDAFTQASGDEAPLEAPSSEETNPLEAKNDDKRYEYWQSQAAKTANELRLAQQQLGQIQKNVQHQTQAQPQQAEAPEQYEEFPPAPDRPEKPRSFNRQEAYEDSSSDSARYLDEMDSWRDDMDEYNSLRGQYDSAIMQEQVKGMQDQQNRSRRVKDAQIQQARQIQQVSEFVQGNYGMSQGESQEFIKTMSDPKSITVDNLVKLYRLERGGGQTTSAPPQPSAAFTQTQRAQAVPQPMGVQPTTNNEASQNSGDKIMDSLISDYNDNNPWK